MFLQKIYSVLTNKEREKILITVFLLIIKNCLEILSIGLLIPILAFIAKDNKQNFIYDYFDFLNELNSKETIILFVSTFIFVYFIKTIYVLLYNRWFAKLLNNLTAGITQRVLSRYLDKNYNFFIEHNSALLTRNLSSETAVFSNGIIGSIISLVTHLVFIISMCCFLIIYNFYSLLVILALSIISLLVIKVTNDKFLKWGKIRQDEAALFLKKINEIVGSIKEIILYGKKFLFLKDVSLHIKRLAQANIFRDIYLTVIAPIIEFIGIFIFFSFLLGLIIYSSLNLGEIIILFGVFAFAAIKLLPAVIGSVRAAQAIKFNLPSLNVVYKILNEKIDNNYEKEEKKNYYKSITSLKLENVDFSYKSKKFNILNNVNFEINKGDKVAIIGETGSGKTTLLNLISSLIFPTKGNITVNNIKDKNLYTNIRKNIGYVSQSVYLLDNSIFYNIALTDDLNEKQKEEILSILKSINLDQIDNELSKDITSIGEKGSKLSGGQIQRLGIARAVFRDPSILILDEATNALDKVNEEKVLDFIFKKFINKIVILCTHKKELLKYCNKVIEVKEDSLEIRKN